VSRDQLAVDGIPGNVGRIVGPQVEQGIAEGVGRELGDFQGGEFIARNHLFDERGLARGRLAGQRFRLGFLQLAGLDEGAG